MVEMWWYQIMLTLHHRTFYKNEWMYKAQDSQLIITLTIMQGMFAQITMSFNAMLSSVLIKRSLFHICRVLVSYKIWQNAFDTNFLLNHPEKNSCFRIKLFSNKDILQFYCINCEFRIIFMY